MTRVKNICIEICKQKYKQMRVVLAVVASTKLVCISKYDNSCHIWFEQLFNNKLVIARCLVQYWQIFFPILIFFDYLTHLKAREISCKIWETRKIFPILHSAQCDNNYITFIKSAPLSQYMPLTDLLYQQLCL